MDEPRPDLVIGAELAAARDAEERRLRAGDGGPSPMPARTYDGWRGEADLFDPRPLPLDAELGQLSGHYRALGRDERAAMRRSISMDEAYTLLTFARRAAVLAIRSGDAATLAQGLAACAAVDVARVDWRDLMVALALLRHAALRVGVDTTELLEDARILGDPALASIIDDLERRPASERELRDAWGYVEVDAPGGVGLLGWGFHPWLPTLDLAAAAVELAAVISADVYRAADPTLAVEMPRVWLADAGDPALDAIVGSARATASVSGRSRPESSPDHAAQQLTLFLLETSDAASASRLAAMARHGRPDTALLGVAAGALFALLVARSFVDGVAAFETTASLARFRAPVSEVLERHSSAG